MTATVHPAMLPRRLFAVLGEPFSTWCQRGDSWEPSEICPQHAELGAEIGRLSELIGESNAAPHVEKFSNGELLVAARVEERSGLRQGTGDRTQMLVSLFPSAESNPHDGWTPMALQRAAALALSREQLQDKVQRLEHESEEIANNLAMTYEEISLLHELTQRLRVSFSQHQLAEVALDWLKDCLPAEAIFLHYEPAVQATPDSRIHPEYSESLEAMHLVVGQCSLNLSQRTRFANALPPTTEFVRGSTSIDGETFHGLRQYVAVSIQDSNTRGWLVAINHTDNDSFSSVEASLLRSVSTILGVHIANRERYEEQANLVAHFIEALASSLDAKDPYTHGHSNRVAQISILLAEALGIDESEFRTIHVGGLLHDIGKIGIDDTVLRKEGKLTDDEFDQIKQHPRLGYQILRDIDPLQEVLPIVLHHHERWDGRGYPDGIAGEDISLHARIAAVADSYDAMTSDRPYRKGMPQARVESILRDGAGTQWDPAVVGAFFKARDEIAKIPLTRGVTLGDADNEDGESPVPQGL